MSENAKTAREILRQTQNGGGSSAPKLRIESQLETDRLDGIPCFSYWDKDKKENIASRNPFAGIFIGHSMSVTAFDKNAGAKGGSWETSHYFTKSDTITLFRPTARGSEKFMTGLVPDVIAEMSKQNLQPKKKYTLYILTLKGKLVSLKSNVTLCINEMNNVKNELSDRVMIFSPKVYDANDTSINKKVHEMLGPLAATNQPTYVRVTPGDELSDKIIEDTDLITHLTEFKAWKDYKVNFKKATENDAPDDKSTRPENYGGRAAGSPDLPMDNRFAPPPAMTSTQPVPDKQNFDDDLPF